ncbi:MAG: pyridoxal phosphate-dependent aminotransferase [Spirochaetota bacterium]
MKTSKRGQMMPSSPIRKLTPYADAAKAKGIEVFHLNIGQPDIETPQIMWDAIKNFNKPVLEYGPSQGFLSLREAVCDYFKNYKIKLNPNEICITIGGSEAIMFAIDSICDPDDEIIVFEPFYANYDGYALSANVKLVPITLKAEDGFHIKDFSEIEKKISPKTKAILIGSPNNPTGTILKEEEVRKIHEIAKKFDLYIISDEVYKEFNFTDYPHFSVLQLDDPERVIVIDSVSKRFSACGARIGTLITKNQDVMSIVNKFAMARLCPPTIEQIAAEAAYRLPFSYYQTIVNEYQKRRDICYNLLTQVDDVVLRKPEGAFYLVVKLPIKNSDLFAKWMLSDFEKNKKTTMVAPASGFYKTPTVGHDEVRIAYVLKEERLKEALMIFIEGLLEYRKVEDKLLKSLI